MATAAISAIDVHKHYGQTRALDGININIDRGQICALLGQNGAGKTTFINTALGLTSADRGAMRVLGMDAGSLPARKRIGVMLQDTDLPDLLTAREHIERFASYYDAPESTDELIERTDIGDFAHKRYKKLSGGQKRRVQFAVALVGNPDVLFLDEPTTGLDQDARGAVWANVRSLADSGTTVILTTHYLEEADALADRIVVINQGQIIADDDADRIRARVGGSLITCETAMSDTQLGAMPSVRSVRRNGRIAQILSEDAAQSLRTLLAEDASVTDLTVSKPSLGEAFTALTQQSGVLS
ncbi:MAG: ABC transporter ATP-binding protein [Pseudomonadota bacterium]